jgi:hypothetical protein
MDIKTIIEHLNHDKANIEQEIIIINDKIAYLNEYLHAKEIKKNNIYITVSMLETLKLNATIGITLTSKKVQKESMKKDQEDTKVIQKLKHKEVLRKNITIKEIIIPILSKHPMTPSEIFNSIEDKTISKDLLNAIYASLGNNKQTFKKDLATKKWSLK